MDLVRRVQRAYPQIYLACHLQHTTSGRDHGMSERDARLLAHLDELAPVTVSQLARHLGVGLSTVSLVAAVLERLGARERAAAVRGLELLARASRELTAARPRRRRA